MPLQRGQTLKGRYVIDRLLGQGGMGAVYRALDTLPANPQPVAIKERVLDGLPDDSDTTRLITDETRLRSNHQSSVYTRQRAAEQFKNEARLLHDFQHSNLPRVSDFFNEADNLYLVMDLIEGQDLDKKLEKNGDKPLREVDVLQWLGQVMDALAYCHLRNIFHRDIKPANIILTPVGKTYLVDFGIARFSSDGRATTILAGSSGFSPIEQFTPKGKVDARSDIYSLGATFYLLLTGKMPEEVMARALNDNLIPPGELNPNISPHIEAAILHALNFKPEDRFANLSEFTMALRPPKPTSNPIPKVQNSQVQKPNPVAQPLSSPVRPSNPPPVAQQNILVFPKTDPTSGRTQTPQPSILSKTIILSPSDNLAYEVRKAPAGSIIRLNPGKYILSTPLIIEKELSIISSSETNNAQIIYSGADAVAIFKEASWHLQHLDFIHKSLSSGDVVKVNGKSISIQNCSFTGGSQGVNACKGCGLVVSGDTSGQLLHCSFTMNHGSGLLIENDTSLDVSHCSFDQNKDGIYYSGNGDIKITACQITRNRANGMSILGNGPFQIEENVCKLNQASGILIGNMARPILINNTLESNESCGIAYIQNASGESINNSCLGNRYHGIYIAGQANPTIQNNRCSENYGNGIAYMENSGGLASSNQCSSNGTFGIFIGGQATSKVYDNKGDRNKKGGLHIDSGSRPEVARNSINSGLFGMIR